MFKLKIVKRRIQFTWKMLLMCGTIATSCEACFTWYYGIGVIVANTGNSVVFDGGGGQIEIQSDSNDSNVGICVLLGWVYKFEGKYYLALELGSDLSKKSVDRQVGKQTSNLNWGIQETYNMSTTSSGVIPSAALKFGLSASPENRLMPYLKVGASYAKSEEHYHSWSLSTPAAGSLREERSGKMAINSIRPLLGLGFEYHLAGSGSICVEITHRFSTRERKTFTNGADAGRSITFTQKGHNNVRLIFIHNIGAEFLF